MKDSNYKLIKDMLKERLESNLGMILHLEHQLEQLPTRRVIDLTDDQIEEALQELRIDRDKCNSALSEFTEEVQF